MTAFRLNGCNASLSSAIAVSTSKLRVTLPCVYSFVLAFECFTQVHAVAVQRWSGAVHMHVQATAGVIAWSAHVRAS